MLLHPLIEIYEILFSYFGEQKWWPGETALEIYLGAILTQNTKWENAEKALKGLMESDLLSLEKIRNSDLSRIQNAVRPAGFFRMKAAALKNFADMIYSCFGGRLENALSTPSGKLRESLLSLNGIGYETADSILLYAALKPFFVVDAYTFRILERHGHKVNQMKYEALRTYIEHSLPRNASFYNEFHALIVATGKTFCFKTNPDCVNCPLGVLFR